MSDKNPALLNSIGLMVVKATLREDGTMRWQCVASDTEPDRAQDRATLDLFKDWIERIEKGIVVPWLGVTPRVPFLGVSHYPDLGGYGEAGITERMYVDGNRFKADGIFHSNSEAHPLAKTLFDALVEERALLKKGEEVELVIRISAAWWDIQHAHGNMIFTRKSLTEKCPLCENHGQQNRTFLKGQLDHFAATRVPMNPRTDLQLQEKSMPTTRKEDAASIVGGELAEDLEKKTKAAMVGKSESDDDPQAALVIKNEEEEADAGTVTKDDTGEAVALSEKAKDGGKSKKKKKDDMDDDEEEDMMPAKSKTVTNKTPEAGEASTAADSASGEEPVPAVTEKMDEGMEAYTYKPFGGATTLAEAEEHQEAEERYWEAWSNWDKFQAIVDNIMTSDDPDLDPLQAISSAMREFSDRIDQLKAGISDAYLMLPTENGGQSVARSETVTTNTPVQSEQPATGTESQTPAAEAQTQAGPVHPADILKARMDAVIADPNLTTHEAKAEAMQQALGNFVDGANQMLQKSAPQDVGAQVASAIERAMTPLIDKIGLLEAKLNAAPQSAETYVGQSQVQPTFIQQPVQKSYQLGQTPEPVVNQGNQQPVSPSTGKPSSLTAHVRRSVGLN